MATREDELDCVIALHNLRVLLKFNPDFDIPERRHALPREHVFSPQKPANEVDLKIPPPIRPAQERDIKHIRDFISFLPSTVPAVKKALETGGDDSVFFPTVGKRGTNLYNGAYVLQLRVQQEEMGVWTVKFVVGASYSYELHTGYFQMTQDNAVAAQICECYSG